MRGLGLAALALPACVWPLWNTLAVQTILANRPRLHGKRANASSRRGHKRMCHTAVAGEKCYYRVVKMMNSENSEAFHLRLRKIREAKTSEAHVREQFRFEDVQDLLRQSDVLNKSSECAKACAAPQWGQPSLFCFSIARGHGYEPKLLHGQLERGAGIFACDGHAVLSEQKFLLGSGPPGLVRSITFPSAPVGTTSDGTAGNTELFIQAWHAIQNFTAASQFDWTLKVDPDALLLPDRLRTHLIPFTGQKVYLKNCDLYHGNAGWPKMYGALEVFSKRAIQSYFANKERCFKQLDLHSWGEDVFMMKCMDRLYVRSVNDMSVSIDGLCSKQDHLKVNCSDETAAVFHPLKSARSWLECWDAVANVAIGAEW